MRYIRLVSSTAMSSTADDWFTRHSVLETARRTAALVNVPSGNRSDPGEVAGVLRDFGEADPIHLTAQDIAQMRAAADRLVEIFAAEHVDDVAAALNSLLRGQNGSLRLTSHGGRAPWHPHLDRDDDAPWGEWFLASSCLALTVLVWDHQRPPGAVCASPSCRNVFITHGRGPERRYCSRRCATRERVAAHRRAHAAD